MGPELMSFTDFSRAPESDGQETPLSDVEIIWRLMAWSGSQRPVVLLRAAQGMKEEITPTLLRALEAVLADPGRFAGDPDFMGAAFALLLLGKFREPKAFPIALGFLHLDLLDLTGMTDHMVEKNFHAVLASTFNGDFAALERLIEDESVPDRYARHVGLRTMATLAALGMMPKTRLERVPPSRRHQDPARAVACLGRVRRRGHELPLHGTPREGSRHVRRAHRRSRPPFAGPCRGCLRRKLFQSHPRI